MSKQKAYGMMGFAARAGKILKGYNTCKLTMEKGRGKLLLLAEDLAENSRQKLIQSAEKNHIEYRIFGDSDEMSHITGTSGKSIFLITDHNFSKVIKEEIDKEVF